MDFVDFEEPKIIKIKTKRIKKSKIEEPIIFEEPITLDLDDPKEEEEDFLCELQNTNQTQQLQTGNDEQETPDCEMQEIQKKTKRVSKKKGDIDIDEQDNIYSNNPTPIVGRSVLVLLQKIKQYRILFPNELKAFKIGKNLSVKQLEDVLQEIECIIEIDTVDSFITDSIIQSIKMAEGVSAYTKNYNISGLSMMLKQNKQFHNLLKQLYLKYNTFASIPPEYQLMMIISTTALICTQKNRQKEEIDKFLNEPVSM
jgi:hypothetical protein